MQVIIEDEYLGILIERGANIENPKYSLEVIKKFQMRVAQIKAAKNTQDLRKLKSLHFEKLNGNLKGKYSIRVNKAYRIIFRIEKDNKVRIEVLYIEDLNNHYQ